MRSQLAAARLGLAALVLAALIAGGAIAAVRMDWMAYADGYRLMFAVVALGVLALAAAISWLAKALKNNDSAGRKPGFIALIGSLLLLYPPLSAFIDGLSAPPIYDVTTDTANPPQFSALLKFRGEGANSPQFDGARKIAYRPQDAPADDPGIHPISYVLHAHYYDLLKPRAGLVMGAEDPVAVFFWRDFEAMKRTGWTIVDFNDKTRRIEATRSSFWFGRISDIVVEARPSGRGARTVVRSQSRHDQVDGGFNADTVERYLTALRGG